VLLLLLSLFCWCYCCFSDDKNIDQTTFSLSTAAHAQYHFVKKKRLQLIIIIIMRGSYIAHFTNVSMRFTTSGGLFRAAYYHSYHGYMATLLSRIIKELNCLKNFKFNESPKILHILRITDHSWRFAVSNKAVFVCTIFFIRSFSSSIYSTSRINL
jgi:hypothetical protein